MQDFSGRYPTEDEVLVPDVWDSFCREYDRVEGKSSTAVEVGRPSRDTVLREIGRQD